MAIPKTDNYEWPLQNDGGGNWGAIWNGILEEIDSELSREIATFNDEVQVLDGFVQKIRQ